MATIEKTVADKVEKLLNLKDHAETTENEMNSAMNAIQRLLSANNITEVEMTDYINSRTNFQDEYVSMGSRKPPRWKSSLAYQLAPYFFCASYNSYGGNVCITGMDEDKRTFVNLLNYLWSTIEMLAIKSFEEHDGYENGRTYKNNFCRGCMQRVVVRMKEEKAKILTNHLENCEEKGMVRYDPYDENAKKIKSHYKTTGIRLSTMSPSKSKHSSAGYGSGYKAGAKIGLNGNGALPSPK
jgi:hypothetical protein